METDTRLFFVVDSTEENEEIYETLEEAESDSVNFTKPRIRVCIVRNSYREDNGEWNYDDYLNTFETIKTISK